jgi:O-antigen/teichoic acid export membrane protein
MNLLEPITSTLAEESRPVLRRALERARIVGNFALVQAVVQLIGFASGILIVRTLAQHEYAYFTIANTMQGTMSVLADIGISVGLISIGGQVWQDRYRFGQLVNTALALRKYLGVIVVLVSTPVLWFLLFRNGAPRLYTVVLVLLVSASVGAQLSNDVLSVVPRLRSDIGRIQKIDFIGAIVRLSALLALMYIYLNAGVAIAVATAVYLLQFVMLRSYARSVIDADAPENDDDREAMLGFVRNLAGNAIFFCLQGQIAVFLISVFGRRASSVAEIGALGRLAMVFALLSNLLTNVFVPAFARAQTTRKLRWLYAGIVAGVSVFGLSILLGANLFPHEVLLVLGGNYTHLHTELVLMIASAVLSSITATLWALNAARAWVVGSWFYIPLTLVTQIALIPFVDFTSVAGVLTFNLVSTVPNLLLNLVLSCRGFHALQSAPA